MSVMSLRELRESGMRKRGRFAVPRFCGWKALREYVEACRKEEVAALFATLFETGCRVSEALQLRGDMFVEEDDEWLVLYRAPVLKKRGHAAVANRLRNVPIPRQEPLVDTMMQYVYAHPGRLFLGDRLWAWREITRVDDRWWCHRIRSERATQLHVEYGYGVPELMKWFNWSTPQEALEYVRLDVTDLKEKMIGGQWARHDKTL